MKQNEIRSLQDYLDLIGKLKEKFYSPVDNFSYRGMSDINYSLQPGIFREIQINKAKTKKYISSEFEILNHFIKEASAYITNVDKEDYLLWMVYAQHYGVPTRLLDFSSNPLVALYFSSKENSNSDGIVWIVNETNFRNWSCQADYTMKNKNISKKELMQRILASIVNPKDIEMQNDNMKRPVSYIPYYFDNRMVAQGSRFMLWGTDTQPLDKIVNISNYMNISEAIEFKVLNDERFIFCCRIPADYKNNILKQLNIVGINEKTLFPCLDGLGKYIENMYKTMLMN